MLLNMYETKTFSQVFERQEDFVSMLKNDFGGYAKNSITDENKEALYWLLYSRYGNNPIINLSENVFKSKLTAIVFQKGPTWQKRVKIQDDIRGLTHDQLKQGAITISNSALNPETEPGTQDTDELSYVNSQNVNKSKRSDLDAYSFLMDLLKTDVTESFIDSFSVLFSKFVAPDITHIYVDDNEEEEL